MQAVWVDLWIWIKLLAPPPPWLAYGVGVGVVKEGGGVWVYLIHNVKISRKISLPSAFSIYFGRLLLNIDIFDEPFTPMLTFVSKRFILSNILSSRTAIVFFKSINR